jgi:hypothetical protein
MTSHKCMACISGRITDPNGWDTTCPFCGGTGWIYDGLETPYYPINHPMKSIQDEEEE